MKPGEAYRMGAGGYVNRGNQSSERTKERRIFRISHSCWAKLTDLASERIFS